MQPYIKQKNPGLSVTQKFASIQKFKELLAKHDSNEILFLVKKCLFSKVLSNIQNDRKYKACLSDIIKEKITFRKVQVIATFHCTRS